MTTSALPRHSREMAIVHRAFRRESRLLAEMTAQVAPGDTARARVLVAHFRDYKIGLHSHHTGEDELMWPPLLARADLESALIHQMEDQHERVAASLDAATAAADGWESSASTAGRDAFVAALAEHRAVLIEHLDDEERMLLPVAERHLTEAEWAALGEHFVESNPKTKLLIFLGMVLEDADESERELMLSGLPGPAKVVWSAIGKPLYARRVHKVRG